MTDLTDRMRTCAAFIKSWNEDDEGAMLLQLSVMLDAAELLIEASNALEAAPTPPGEPSIEDRPMEVVPPSRTSPPAPEGFIPLAGTIDWHAPGEPAHVPLPTWIAPGEPLPGLRRSGTISGNTCPKCDSRAAKRVHRQGKSLVLECSVCGHAWKRA